MRTSIANAVPGLRSGTKNARRQSENAGKRPHGGAVRLAHNSTAMSRLVSTMFHYCFMPSILKHHIETCNRTRGQPGEAQGEDGGGNWGKATIKTAGGRRLRWYE